MLSPLLYLSLSALRRTLVPACNLPKQGTLNMNPKGSSPSLLDDKIMEAIRQGALRPVKITPLDYTQALSLIHI